MEMITDGVRKVVALGKYKNHRTRVDTATLDRYNAGEANLAPEHIELCEVENLRLRIDKYIGNLFKELGEG